MPCVYKFDNTRTLCFVFGDGEIYQEEVIIIVRDFNFKNNMGCYVFKGTYGWVTFKVYPMIWTICEM